MSIHSCTSNSGDCYRSYPKKKRSQSLVSVVLDSESSRRREEKDGHGAESEGFDRKHAEDGEEDE